MSQYQGKTGTISFRKNFVCLRELISIRSLLFDRSFSYFFLKNLNCHQILFSGGYWYFPASSSCHCPTVLAPDPGPQFIFPGPNPNFVFPSLSLQFVFPGSPLDLVLNLFSDHEAFSGQL